MKLPEFVTENVSWESDLQLNKGPADVLDHASRKFAVHGKVGIDATNKEKFAQPSLTQLPDMSASAIIPKVFSDFEKIEGIPVLIASLANNIMPDELLGLLADSKSVDALKIILLVDNEVDKKECNTIAWMVFK